MKHLRIMLLSFKVIVLNMLSVSLNLTDVHKGYTYKQFVKQHVLGVEQCVREICRRFSIASDEFRNHQRFQPSCRCLGIVYDRFGSELEINCETLAIGIQLVIVWRLLD